jgi:hypothetical protein
MRNSFSTQATCCTISKSQQRKNDLQPYTQDASDIVSKANLFELNKNPPTLLSVERAGYPYGTFERQISRSAHLSNRSTDHQISSSALQQISRSATPDQQISRSVNQQCADTRILHV